ncbi:MAG: FmdB family zinc ribbon protein [Gemmatimonadaceae bacterium]
MPTYEFRCPKGHEFEKFFRSISGAPSVLPCPTCGKNAARQMSAGAGLLFKGSGFYITDYGKDGKKGLTPAPSDGEAPAASGEPKAATAESSAEAKTKPEKDATPAGVKPATPASAAKTSPSKATKRSE